MSPPATSGGPSAAWPSLGAAADDDDDDNDDNDDDDEGREDAAPPPPPPAPPSKDDADAGRPAAATARRRQAPPPPRYGADRLAPRQFALVQLALLLGTAIEWFDFSVYGALAAVLAPLFFPAGGGASTQALYFWGVFALSFATRPVGALVLGSVGDRWGRRPALLASLGGMAVPTVLIGCLPTYAQAGVAAPAMLACLRAVQGLAMGCEFCGAMVYSVELAPAGRRGLYGSITSLGGVVGIGAGNAAVMILHAALSPEQIAAFGWRLPFLATAVSALGALTLRMRMPEPRAWEACASGGRDRDGGPRAAGGARGDGADAAAVGEDGGEKGQGLPADSHRTAERLAASAPPAAPPAPPPPSAAAAAVVVAIPSSGGKPARCCARARPRPRRPPRRHTPGVSALKLLRRSWPQVLLQALFEAFVSVAFYVFVLWLPSALQKAPAFMPAQMAGGATIAALTAMGLASLAGGALSDACASPRRRLAASAAAVAVGGAVVVPGLVSVTRLAGPPGGSGGAYCAAALLQAGVLSLAGVVLGIVPSLCAELYAPDVRLVSFSLAHNLSMSLLGGTAPLVVSALAGTAAGAAGAGPGVYVAAAGCASLLAALALAIWAPRLFVAAAAAEGMGGDEEEEEDGGKRAVPTVATTTPEPGGRAATRAV